MMENISDRLVKELGKNPEAKLEDVECLQKWCDTNNLPPFKDFELLELHHSCFYRIEETKKCIRSYFKIRRSAPELFTNRDVTTQPLKDYVSTVAQCFPIGATKDGHQILLSRMLTDDAYAFNNTMDIQLLTLAMEVLLHKVGTFPGLIMLVDNDKVTMKHFFRMKWSHIRVIINYMQEGLPLRLESVQVISSSVAAKYGLAAIRPFTSGHLLDKIVYHLPADLSTLHKIIPVENLPQEYGGTLPSCDKLHSDYIKDFTAMKRYFDDKDAFETTEPTKK